MTVVFVVVHDHNCCFSCVVVVVNGHNVILSLFVNGHKDSSAQFCYSGHGVSGRSRRSMGGSATRRQIGAVVQGPLSPSPTLRPPTPAAQGCGLAGAVDSMELACGFGVLFATPARLLLRGAPIGRTMHGGWRCRWHLHSVHSGPKNSGANSCGTCGCLQAPDSIGCGGGCLRRLGAT
jgi:hypothetical protein